MGFVEARKELAEAIGEVEGVRKSAVRIPESFDGGPFVAAHAHNGSYEMGPVGRVTGLHNIMIEIHVKRQDLPRDYDTMEPLLDKIALHLNRKLKNADYNNLQTFAGITYEVEPAVYGDDETPTLTIFITLHEVKIQYTL